MRGAAGGLHRDAVKIKDWPERVHGVMRVYLAIFSAALLLLVILGLTAPLWVGDYLTTAEFRQTAFVEIGSFILTSAVVGGLSAAVAEYLRQRELQPLRMRAFQLIDQATDQALKALLDIMTSGPTDSHLAFYGAGATPTDVIVTADFKLRRPDRVSGTVVRARWTQIKKSIANLHRALDRYAASFPVREQEDFGAAERFFDELVERLNIVDCVLGEQRGTYRIKLGFEAGLYREDYQALRDALARIADACGTRSQAVERLDGNLEFLGSDVRYVAKALHAMAPDHEQAGAIARSFNAWWDFERPVEDMQQYIKARVPLSEVGGHFDRAINFYAAIATYGFQTVSQWQRDYPPPAPPDLRLVE